MHASWITSFLCSLFITLNYFFILKVNILKIEEIVLASMDEKTPEICDPISGNSPDQISLLFHISYMYTP